MIKSALGLSTLMLILFSSVAFGAAAQNNGIASGDAPQMPEFRFGISVEMGAPIDLGHLGERADVAYGLVEEDDLRLVWRFGDTDDWAFVRADGRATVASFAEFDLETKTALKGEVEEAWVGLESCDNCGAVFCYKDPLALEIDGKEIASCDNCGSCRIGRVDVGDLVLPGELNVSCNNPPRPERRDSRGADISHSEEVCPLQRRLLGLGERDHKLPRPESSAGSLGGISPPDFAALTEHILVRAARLGPRDLR